MTLNSVVLKDKRNTGLFTRTTACLHWLQQYQHYCILMYIWGHCILWYNNSLLIKLFAILIINFINVKWSCPLVILPEIYWSCWPMWPCSGSLRKHPFLLALRHLGRFAWRNVCDSVTEIPYWWRKICPKSGQKRWLVDGVVTLF